ncbi:metal-dependent transcriptional regulator [Caproicibacterium amylolyticum]|uniref:Metal-dependent transcriptional regulator n=1 Tax=Caproicibacterium amylolyticum TaxID=2766537 RepID=A0A7G9WEN7_9FIRM|nr:metal-dependent transcriptional regulator [Caproicibacterium amylolyticum]MBE6722969.1 metal-dependent transcriptional regulator [Oscillospiraceae bacterium]QNO17149.1 metal-dependent transcriptional regulator [Caproicibacterium amylolyticum]
MKIHESAEDYLESILMLKEQLGMVRSIDIVNKTGYSKPSISVAMKHLRENGYIKMDTEGYITLTDSGMKIASNIYTRHRVLTKLLVSLGVDEETAAADACRMEHDLSEKSFGKIREHAEQHLK